MGGIASGERIGGCDIRNCTCKHDWQDKTYGKGRRVMNACRGGYVCTVCSTKSLSHKSEDKKEEVKS